MRISLNWLHDLVDFDLSPADLGEALTLVGFEVEDIEDRATWADGVVVGRILEAETHPNADRLRVCQVDVGGERPLNIVCGAANARAGIIVPVAVPGVYLPVKDLQLQRTELRGVVSEGMICSLAELGLEKSSEGIHEFDTEPELGQDVRPLLGLDDVVLDLTSTANRADALSMVGIAREVAALTRNSVRLPLASVPESPPVPELKLAIEDPQACPAYSGTLIKGVKIGASPEWLQRRLASAGTRSINNVVDITNLVLLEWGQPLHAFDWDRLQTVMGSTPQVGVRRALPEETLKTLDGQERALQLDNLLITAADQPVALAGVMGGEATEVDEDTQNIFLEAALFDPVKIRRSARAQAVRTEASARYERGVDFSALDGARDRAVALILELAGGELVGQTVFDARDQEERRIELRLSRLIDILGDDVPAKEVEEILPALGFEMSACELRPTPVKGSAPETESFTTTKCVWQIKVPPYRMRDVEREIDLIEEFARLHGYDRFSETLPPETEVGMLSPREKALRQIREVFRGVGLTELFHISLCPADSGVDVVISNPMSPEYSALRQELIPDLIESFQRNWAQGSGVLNGFEIGRVFWRQNGHYREADHLAGILGHGAGLNDWQHKAQEMDWFTAKGYVVATLDRLGITPITFQPDREHPLLHPGRTATLWLGETYLGRFGQLHPLICQERDLPRQVYSFELDMDLIVAQILQRGLAIYQPFSIYPASDRDIAFYVPLSVTVAELEQTIREAGGELLESVQLFDEYRGQGVPEDQRSLAFRTLYRAPDRTLKEAEVEEVQQRVRSRLEEKFGVTLRS